MFSLLSIHFFVRTGGENSLFQRYYFVCRYVFLGESSTQVHYPFFKLNYLFFAIELQKLFIYLRYQPLQPVASFIHKEEWKEASDSETCFQMLETFLLVDYTYTFLPNNASFSFPFALSYLSFSFHPFFFLILFWTLISSVPVSFFPFLLSSPHPSQLSFFQCLCNFPGYDSFQCHVFKSQLIRDKSYYRDLPHTKKSP